MASKKVLPFLLTRSAGRYAQTDLLVSLRSFGSGNIRREVSCPKLRDQILIKAGHLWADLEEIIQRARRPVVLTDNELFS